MNADSPPTGHPQSEPPRWGWPPPPPAPSEAPWGPPPPPPPPRHRAQALAIALIALALASGGVGAGLGVALHGGSSDGTGPALSAPSQLPFDSAQPPSGQAPGSSSSSSSRFDASSIARQVDPAVADITATLAGHAGMAAGTGMVITPTGEVLTNNHVIQGASSIRVQLGGTGPTFTARVLGVDPSDDVALLQIQNAANLPTVSLGDSSGVSVGDPVVAIGNAFGLAGPPTVTKGSVTGLNRTITAGDATGTAETLHGLIQINAAIRPGDSGGPLLDRGGHVIGMNTAASVSALRRVNVAFAIPIKAAAAVAQQIQAGHFGGKVQGGEAAFLGVDVQNSGADVGARVTGIQPGTPAASSGLARGDVIVSIGGQSIESADALGPAIRSHRPGDRVEVSWFDPSGQRHTATVQLATGPPA